MATQSTGLPVRAVMFSLKILIPVLALFLLLNMFWIPHLGRFSCSVAPWFVPVARADGACPGSLHAAMADAGWAAERWEEIRDERQTVGLFYDEDGHRHRYESGDQKGADAERARRVLRDAGASRAPNGSYPAASHVETKVAALMHEHGVRRGTLVINNLPCGGDRGLSCQEVLSLMLPPGTMLRLWYPKAGAMEYLDFVGR